MTLQAAWTKMNTLFTSLKHLPQHHERLEHQIMITSGLVHHVGVQDRGEEKTAQLGNRRKHMVLKLDTFFLLLTQRHQHTHDKRETEGCTGMHTVTTQLLKITVCEKSVYFLRLHPPRAIEHPGPTYPPGLASHFSCDLHLIPSTRTTLGLTSWATLVSGLGAEEGSCLTSSSDPVWSCDTELGTLNLTVPLRLKDASDPDLTTSFILVPGFLFLFRTPKHPQSLRSVNMTMNRCSQNQTEIQVNVSKYPCMSLKIGSTTSSWSRKMLCSPFYFGLKSPIKRCFPIFLCERHRYYTVKTLKHSLTFCVCWTNVEEDLTLTPGHPRLKRRALLNEWSTQKYCLFPNKLSSRHADVLICLCSFNERLVISEESAEMSIRGGR